MLDLFCYYRCHEYYLAVYPTSQSVNTATGAAKAGWAALATAGPEGGGAEIAINIANDEARFLSKNLGVQVRYTTPDDLIFPIQTTKSLSGLEDLYFCVFPEFFGWIIHREFLTLEKVPRI